MPITIDELSAAIHGFFAQKIGGAGGDTPGSIVVVFDGLGTTLSAKEFGVGGSTGQQQLLAHQRAAQLADQLPGATSLSKGWYLPRTGARLSQWYKAALTASVAGFGTDEAKQAFERLKAGALERLDLNQLVLVGGATPGGPGVNPTGVVDDIFATSMAPPDWFLPEADSWQQCSFDGSQPASPTPTPVPVPVFDAQVLVTMPDEPGLHPGPVSFFRQAGEAVSEGDPLASVHYFSDEHPDQMVGNTLLAPASGTLLEASTADGDTVQAGDQLAVIGVRRRAAERSAQNVVNMPNIVKPSFTSSVNEWHKAVGDAVAVDEPLVGIRFFNTTTDEVLISEITSPVPGVLIEIDKVVGEAVEAGTQLAIVADKLPGETSTPTGYSVGFDYCIVNFDRPWWDEVFLTSPDWSMPGFQRGQIASGSAANTASTAITLITVGMVVLRNLKITASWTDEERDQLTSGALNLGPFSLTGADVNNQTLTRAGMQTLAWICQVPPILPPS